MTDPAFIALLWPLIYAAVGALNGASCSAPKWEHVATWGAWHWLAGCGVSLALLNPLG